MHNITCCSTRLLPSFSPYQFPARPLLMQQARGQIQVTGSGKLAEGLADFFCFLKAQQAVHFRR